MLTINKKENLIKSKTLQDISYLEQVGDGVVAIGLLFRAVFVKPNRVYAVVARAVYVGGQRVAYHIDVVRFFVEFCKARVEKFFVGF